jgi:hypothetical protein
MNAFINGAFVEATDIRATNPLVNAHIDIWVPARITNSWGAKLFLTSYDNFTKIST